MGVLANIAHIFFACLFSITCSSVPTDWHSISLEPSSANVTVVTSVNGSTTRKVLHAPYGVRTNITSRTDANGVHTEASSTALTLQEDEKEKAQLETELNQMSRLLAHEDNIFDDLWKDLPL